MEIERTCQIPIPWQNGPNGAVNAVWQAMCRDRALAVRVLDYALGDVMLGYEGTETVTARPSATPSSPPLLLLVQSESHIGRWLLLIRSHGSSGACQTVSMFLSLCQATIPSP